MKKLFTILIFCIFSYFMFSSESEPLQNNVIWLVEGPVEVIQGWWEEEVQLGFQQAQNQTPQSIQTTQSEEDLKGALIKPIQNPCLCSAARKALQTFLVPN